MARSNGAQRRTVVRTKRVRKPQPAIVTTPTAESDFEYVTCRLKTASPAHVAEVRDYLERSSRATLQAILDNHETAPPMATPGALPGAAAQTTLKDIDLAAIMGMLGRTSPPFVAGLRKSLEESRHVPPTLEESYRAGRLKAPSAAAEPESEAPAETEIEPGESVFLKPNLVGAGTSDPEENAEADAVPSLADLTRDLPDTGFRMELQAVPAAVEIRRGIQIALGVVTDRVAHLEEYLTRYGSDCDDTSDDEAGIATVLARRALREVNEQVEELRQGLLRYFVAFGWGRMVELDDRTIGKVKDVLASAPRYMRARTELAIVAAVNALAELPNRGGLLAVAEQERLAALDAKSPQLRAIQAATGKPESYFKDGWPWTDAKGIPLTARSEYGGKGTNADARGRRVS